MLLFPVLVLLIVAACALCWELLARRERRLGGPARLRRLHALLLAGGGAAGLLWASGVLLADRVLQPVAMLLPVLMLGLPLLALLLLMARGIGVQRANRDTLLLGTPAVLALSVVLVWAANIMLDRSPAEFVELGPARIETRDYPLLGQRHALLAEYRTEGAVREMRFPLSFVRYRELQRLWLANEADSVIVEHRPGALGLRWVKIPAEGF